MNNAIHGIALRRGVCQAMKSVFRASSIVSLFLATSLSYASPTAPHKTSSAPSLYDRLGGKPIVEQVIGRMVDLAAADIRTRHTFDGVSLKALKEGVVSHLCEATGGPCDYEGGSLKDAHAHLGITAAQFKVVEHYFIQAMNESHVSPSVQKDVMRLLGPMQPDVVSN